MDLSLLTKEQKLELYDAIQEKKRRLKLEEAVYTPNAGQILVHKCTKGTRAVFAGNGSGKTALACNEALFWMKGYNSITQKFTKTPNRTVIVLDHPEKVADLYIPELSKWTTLNPEHLNKRGKPYISQITKENGSEILFMFHEASPLLFESIEADNFIFDEPPPRHIWVALNRAGRKRGRKPNYLIIATPISASWLRTDIYEKWQNGELDDVECFRFGTVVNEANLADGYIERFSAMLSEKERRIRLEGEFFDLEGLALAHLFKRETHAVDDYQWPVDQPVVIATDPHPSKPHIAIMLGVDKDDHLYVIKELRAKQVAREFASTLKEWAKGYRVIDWISDSLGSSEYTGGEGFKSFIQILNEEGIRIRSTTWSEKNDEDFIERVRDVLYVPVEENNFGVRVPKLRVFSSCHGTISDIENVAWQSYRDFDIQKPKLEITHRDYLACLKYALATSLTFNKQKAKIWRPTKTVTSYGVGQDKVNRLRFSRHKKSMNYRNQKQDDESDW